MGLPPRYILFLLKVSDNLSCQMMLGVLHYGHSDVCAFAQVSAFTNALVDVTDVVDGILHETESFSHLSIPAFEVLPFVCSFMNI